MMLRSVVPCNGCKRCCNNDLIVLHPENGDIVGNYRCHETINPLDGKKRYVLDQKLNGECIYLDERGCSIHETAPVICREFDCRLFFIKFNRNERRHLVRTGMVAKEIFEAGKQRLGTL